VANIFISYSRQSKAVTKALVDDVEALGHTVWFDQELSGGQAWWDQILSMIRRCDFFVFALDPAALNSVACKLEYGYAADLRKPILPILISEGVSTNLLPPSLSQIQFVDYRNQDHPAALRLARAFSAVPPPPALPDPLQVPPGAPISYLGSLAAKLETTSLLTYEEQSALVFDLKKELRDPVTADDTRTLLKTFRKRRDLLAGIAEEIDELFAGLRETSLASPPASAMTPPFWEQSQKEETAPRPSKEKPQRQKTRGFPSEPVPPATHDKDGEIAKPSLVESPAPRHIINIVRNLGVIAFATYLILVGLNRTTYLIPLGIDIPEVVFGVLALAAGILIPIGRFAAPSIPPTRGRFFMFSGPGLNGIVVLGVIAFATYLILVGLNLTTYLILGIGIPQVVFGVLALAAGILILIGRFAAPSIPPSTGRLFMFSGPVGILLLAIYLILVGITVLLHFAIPVILTGILALAAGILILIGK